MINWVHTDAMKDLQRKVKNGEELTDYDKARLRVLLKKFYGWVSEIWDNLPPEFKEFHEEVLEELEKMESEENE